MQVRAETVDHRPGNPNRTQQSVCCPGIEEQFEPRFFKALGDPTRVSILVQLARSGHPCSVSELAEQCPVDLSVVSRHLSILRDAGIVDAERRGRHSFYTARLTDVIDRLTALTESLGEALHQQGTCC